MYIWQTPHNHAWSALVSLGTREQSNLWLSTKSSKRPMQAIDSTVYYNHVWQNQTCAVCLIYLTVPHTLEPTRGLHQAHMCEELSKWPNINVWHLSITWLLAVLVWSATGLGSCTIWWTNKNQLAPNSSTMATSLCRRQQVRKIWCSWLFSIKWHAMLLKGRAIASEKDTPSINAVNHCPDQRE